MNNKCYKHLENLNTKRPSFRMAVFVLSASFPAAGLNTSLAIIMVNYYIQMYSRH